VTCGMTSHGQRVAPSTRPQRRAVLKWGPAGMQQLSETRQNGLRILACAGNTAPDHIDHLHGLPAFLKMLLDER